MPLSKKQRRILQSAEATGLWPKRSELRYVPGFHFCPDLSFKAVCDDSPERCDQCPLDNPPEENDDD
jgi:hypothetical protein